MIRLTKEGIQSWIQNFPFLRAKLQNIAIRLSEFNNNSSISNGANSS